jgi:hypothetical protein
MSGVIPPLLNMPSWRGAQLKHRDNFTFKDSYSIARRLNQFSQTDFGERPEVQ